MSEESQEPPRAGQPAPEAETDSAAADTPPRKEGAEDALVRAEAQAAEFRDRYLRVAAELENFRRRAERERQDVAKFAITAFARDALTVLDNLRRGLETVTAEARRENPALEALAAGMELTEREMLTTLERHGIEKVDPRGEPFDHNFHQAMMEVEDASVAPGTVAQVLQAGYVLNGRLLRPAMVAVARGGAKESGAKPAKVQAPIANQEVEDEAPSAAPGGGTGDETSSGSGSGKSDA